MRRVPSWVAPAAFALALASISLNLYLLQRLRHPAALIESVAPGLLHADGTLRLTVAIPAGTPLRFDVPVDERVSIRVDTTIPVSTRAQLPIRSPLGNYQVSVPVRADVPLRGVLPFRIRHTFRLRTRTSEEISLPVVIKLGDAVVDSLLAPLPRQQP